MTQTDIENLIKNALHSIPLQLGFDEGRLVCTAEKIYFIVQRWDQLRILEEWNQRDLIEYRQAESLMGQELILRMKDGRYSCTHLPEDIDWDTVFHSKASQVKIPEPFTPTIERTVDEPREEQKISSEELPPRADDSIATVAQKLGVEQSFLNTLKEHKSPQSPRQEYRLPKEEMEEGEKKTGGGCIKSIFWLIFVFGFLIPMCNEM